MIASVIISQQTQGLWKITYLTLMAFITKELCIHVEDSNIPVLLLAITRSARYWISQYLLSIQLLKQLNWREGGVIGKTGVTYTRG